MLEHLCHLLHPLGNTGVQPLPKALHGHPHPQAPNVGGEGGEQPSIVAVHSGAVPAVLPLDQVQHSGAVGSVPAQGAHLVQRGGIGHQTIPRHGAIGGF